MIEFFDCDVIINGNGVVADSVSIRSQNSVESIRPFGFSRGIQVPVGGVQSFASISYVADLVNEPNLTLINQLKNGTSSFPIRVEIGGLYGSFYLQDYSFRVAPNEYVKINANYVSYEPLSGTVSPKRGTITYEVTNNTIPHGWTTFVTSSGSYLNVPTYELGYTLNLTWEPIYTLGRKTPLQYQFHGGTENLTLLRDEFYHIEFSGENVTNRLLSSSVSNQIELKALSFKWEINDYNPITFNLADAQINTAALEGAPGEYLRSQIGISRNF